MKTCLGMLIALAAAAACAAPQTSPSMVISTDWLASHLGDESLVVLHVGSQKDYDAGHIPGARLLTLGDISITGERGLRLEMPPVETLERAFGRVGVTDAANIVVYPGTDSVQSATRVWLTFDYLGLGARTSLLDGGLAAWRAEARPLGSVAPGPEERKFTARPQPDRIVNAQWVSAHLNDGQVQILDARLPEFYTGANAGSMPRAGHIPGARNVPYPSVFDEHGKLRPVDSLREILSAPGRRDPALTVSYCHIGYQATVLYFVARYLGLDARLYDGSFQDWSSQPELPVKPAH